MKNSTPLFKTLLVAAAAMGFCASHTRAEIVDFEDDATSITLSDGYIVVCTETTNTPSTNWAGKTFVISGNTITSETWGTGGYQGSWIAWANQPTFTASLGASGDGNAVKIEGSGFLGITLKDDNGSNAATLDMTNVDASSFTGQISVVNKGVDRITVSLKGDWSGTEYIFGGVTDEWSETTTASGGYWCLSDISNGTVTQTTTEGPLFSRGWTTDNLNTNVKDDDVLALQGDTTFAGITGVSKDYAIGGLNVSGREYITVSSEGTKLTLAGTGSYEFYGTVGGNYDGSVTRASIVMNSSDGNGKQTFGGTNYLQNVTVTAGTLALGGTTDISGAVSVTGGTLDISGSTTFGSTITVESGTLNLSGEITLSSAITNSGTVVVDSSVVFALGNLAGSSDGNSTTYVIITNTGDGSITGWDSLDYSNFGLESARQLTSSSDGTITIDLSKSAHDLTWAGTSGNSTWTNNSSVTNWTNGSNSDYFASGDNVTFGSTDASTITLGEAITAGNITFTQGGYTISNGDGTSLTASTLTVEGKDGTTVTIATSSAEFTNINLANHSSTGESGDSANDEYKHLVFGNGTEKTTVTVTGTLTLAGQSEVQVAANSTLTVGSIISQGGYHTSISGEGTLITDAITQQTSTGNVFEISIANLQVGTVKETVAATLIFSSNGTVDIGTMTVSAAGNITFKGEGIYTIGSYSTTNTSGSTLTLGEGTQVTMGTLSAAWHETVTLGTGATLTVTEELSVHTATTDAFSGGTINAEKLNIYNNTTIAKFSDTNLNIGSGGIVNTGSGYLDFGDGLTVGVYEGVNGGNTSWSSSVAIHFTGTDTGTTFNTKGGETITLSGTVSGDGSMIKNGAGTLELSGTNTFTGGVTVSAGTVVAGSSSALGTGDVSVAAGATLQLNTAVSISGESSTVAFAEGAKLIISGGLLEQLEATALSVDNDAVAIIVANDISFGEQSVSETGDLDSLINAYVSAGNYLLTWTWNDGTLSASIVRTIPEPSMFGLSFGLGAIGLVATRRRRRKVA